MTMMLLLTLLLTFDQTAPGARQLFESGRYPDVVTLIQTTPADQRAPDQLFLLAQSQLKLDRAADAQATLTPLVNRPADDPWRLIAESAVAQIAGDVPGAIDRATKAAALAPTSFHAQYQLGLALSAKPDPAAAAAAFELAAGIDPQFAYAHYYAGLSYYNAKRIDRMTTHFESFVKLAPNAPERPAVESILRSVRGR